jgi:hypothetical protein
VFLIVLPLQRTLKVFKEQGLGPKKNHDKADTKRVRVKKHQGTAHMNGGVSSAGSPVSPGGPGFVAHGLSDFGLFGGMFGGGPPATHSLVPEGVAQIEEVSDVEDDDARRHANGDDDPDNGPGGDSLSRMSMPTPELHVDHSSASLSVAGSSTGPGTQAWGQPRTHETV